MKNTTLLIMAAGIGSRFGGGIKQLEPVGLQCGNIELEIFGVSNPPARVSHPEAAKM